jgi:hypothetical protein
MSSPISEWSAKISAWRQSGLTVAAWCRTNSVSYYRFLYWRKRLPELDHREGGSFVQLNVAAANPHNISLECNGVTVHLSSGFDPELLGDVLSLLRRV